MTRTTKEILDKISEHKGELFGFIASDLIEYLPMEEARRFLNREAIMKIDHGEDTWHQLPSTKEAIKAQIINYLPFAWGKANDERGLSAYRSLQHMAAWFWMLGEDDFYEFLKGDDYDHYGKPKLVAASEAVGYNWKPEGEEHDFAGSADLVEWREKFPTLKEPLTW